MRRAVFLLLVAVSCLGCNATGPGFGRWATGPQLIPPPPTGSFGQPATTSPYYQSRGPLQDGLETTSNQVSPGSPTAGRQTPRTPLLTTSQTPELSPGTVTSAGLETTAEAGSSGWRSPGEIIQRATAEESQGDTSARHDSPLRHQINAATFPIHSVLVDEPNEVVESRLARQSSLLAIQPMAASGTVLETSEPRRLDVPDQLTEITNLPLVGQSVAPASREVQELTVPATASGNGFRNGVKPGQWRQSGVDVR